MLARLCRNNPTGISFNIYSILVASHKFRQEEREEREEEVLFQECKQRYIYIQIFTRFYTWSIEI
jgi:hypothetical protein